MSQHPTFYRDLLRRRFHADPGLTHAERQELDLHLLICPECNFDYARMLVPQAPQVAEALLHDLEGAFTADLVAPYLGDLARAFAGGGTLSKFYQLLWHFVSRNPEALGRFRLAEAELWLTQEDP
jgi:hypothetical protein